MKMATVERYGPGADAGELEPGDFILTHRHKPLAGLISRAQKRRFKGPDAPYAHWSHAAVIVPNRNVVEAETLGVARHPITRYHDDEYHVVRLGDELSADRRQRVVAYAERQVGQGFGFLDMLGDGLYLLFGWPLRWVRRNHEICSSLVVEALQQGGLLRDFDPPTTLPADLAKAFDVRP